MTKDLIVRGNVSRISFPLEKIRVPQKFRGLINSDTESELYFRGE